MKGGRDKTEGWTLRAVAGMAGACLQLTWTNMIYY